MHTVQGGGGLGLHVRERGRADGPPILLIHGLSQSHLCWAEQYQSMLADEFRLVACDLRGHGMSEAPLEPEDYTDGQLWADDVAAIIEQLHLDRPVLVGWSYGGFIICDDQHPGHTRPGQGFPSQAARRRRDAAVLEHGRAGTDPGQSGGARHRRRRRAARAPRTAAGHPGPRRHGRAAGDGRARPGHLPDRRAPPGTRASATRRTCSSPSASTASWPS
jgi:pimeloyl-ACP methyl ester carboxylesterase